MTRKQINLSMIENLEQKRKDKGLSREKLAALAGVTSQTIWRIENGLNTTIKTHNKIIHALENYKGDENFTDNSDTHIPVSGSDYVVVIN